MRIFQIFRRTEVQMRQLRQALASSLCPELPALVQEMRLHQHPIGPTPSRHKSEFPLCGGSRLFLLRPPYLSCFALFNAIISNSSRPNVSAGLQSPSTDDPFLVRNKSTSTTPSASFPALVNFSGAFGVPEAESEPQLGGLCLCVWGSASSSGGTLRNSR